MMLALSVLRILLALSLVFVLCSAAGKSFLKGLLIGSLLGHKKGAHYHEGKGEPKDIHHYEKEYIPPPVIKEYVPVPYHEPQEPQYYPVYIVKECPKKYNSLPLAHHHHDHHHSYDYAANKAPDYGSGGDAGDAGDEYRYASSSKYKGTLDGYSESRYFPTRNIPNYTKGSGGSESENNDNNIGIVLSVNKHFQNRY